jgi:hypothetical protein
MDVLRDKCRQNFKLKQKQGKKLTMKRTQQGNLKMKNTIIEIKKLIKINKLYSK